MLDIAFTEIFFISVLALVLLGPKELPVVLKTLGRWIGKLRSLSEGFQKHLYDLDLEEEYVSYKETQKNYSPPSFPDEDHKKKGVPLPSPHVPKNH